MFCLNKVCQFYLLSYIYYLTYHSLPSPKITVAKENVEHQNIKEQNTISRHRLYYCCSRIISDNIFSTISRPSNFSTNSRKTPSPPFWHNGTVAKTLT